MWIHKSKPSFLVKQFQDLAWVNNFLGLQTKVEKSKTERLRRLYVKNLILGNHMKHTSKCGGYFKLLPASTWQIMCQYKNKTTARVTWMQLFCLWLCPSLPPFSVFSLPCEMKGGGKIIFQDFPWPCPKFLGMQQNLQCFLVSQILAWGNKILPVKSF